VIKNLYVIALGLLLGITATATISYFTTPPKMPAYPTELSYPDAVPMPSVGPESEMQNRLMTEQKKYDEQMKSYNATSSNYNYNINIMRVAAAVVLLVIAGALFGRVPLFPEAFAAGGVMVLLGISSSTLVSFFSFDTTMSADATFKVGPLQLGSLYAATVIAGAAGFLVFRKKS
jgi:hypothetical protein